MGTKRQLEEDIDQEIEELKEKFETELGSMRDLTLKFKGENGIMKKKFSQQSVDILDQREELKLMMEKEKELQQQIAELRREINLHKKDIKDRDETIASKERTIYELKKKN